MNFSETFIKNKILKNYSLDDISAKIYVSRDTLASWESGVNYPTIPVLYRLSKLFEIDFEEFLTCDDIKTKLDINQIAKDSSKKQYIRKTIIAISFLAFTSILSLVNLLVVSENIKGFILILVIGAVIVSLGSYITSTYIYLKSEEQTKDDKSLVVKKSIFIYVVSVAVVIMGIIVLGDKESTLIKNIVYSSVNLVIYLSISIVGSKMFPMPSKKGSIRTLVLCLSLILLIIPIPLALILNYPLGLVANTGAFILLASYEVSKKNILTNIEKTDSSLLAK